MHTLNGYNGSPKTVIPYGDQIRILRRGKSWTQAEAVWQSHMAIEAIVLSGNADPALSRRYKLRKRSGAGLGEGAMPRLENNKPVNLLTLKIVALTLGVPFRTLIHPEDPAASCAG